MRRAALHFRWPALLAVCFSWLVCCLCCSTSFVAALHEQCRDSFLLTACSAVWSAPLAPLGAAAKEWQALVSVAYELPG